MAEQNLDENFYEAAIRHWIGGCVLEEAEEYDSAVGMHGFAAECVLKKIWERMLWKMEQTADAGSKPKDYRHFGEILFRDIAMMFSGGTGVTDVIDPAGGLRLAKIHLPQVLFQKHPDRRYFRDNLYSAEDARICRMAAQKLIWEMVRMRLDGYI